MASLCMNCKRLFDCEWFISGGTRIPRNAKWQIVSERYTRPLITITSCPYYEIDTPPKPKPKIGLHLTVYAENGKKIGFYDSVQSAARALKVSPSAIYRIRHNKKRKAGKIQGMLVVFEESTPNDKNDRTDKD